MDNWGHFVNDDGRSTLYVEYIDGQKHVRAGYIGHITSKKEASTAIKKQKIYGHVDTIVIGISAQRCENENQFYVLTPKQEKLLWGIEQSLELL